MDELLKSLPLAAQYVVFALVGLGVAARMVHNIVRGWRDSDKGEGARADPSRGIMAVSTATLADMRPMDEAAKKLAIAAETLGGVSGNLTALLPLVPMLRETGEDLAKLLAIIERRDHEGRERDAYERGRREGGQVRG